MVSAMAVAVSAVGAARSPASSWANAVQGADARIKVAASAVTIHCFVPDMVVSRWCFMAFHATSPEAENEGRKSGAVGGPSNGVPAVETGHAFMVGGVGEKWQNISIFPVFKYWERKAVEEAGGGRTQHRPKAEAG